MASRVSSAQKSLILTTPSAKKIQDKNEFFFCNEIVDLDQFKM